AYHFDCADESARALPYALAAAEQARAQHSLEIAAQQYRIAQRGARQQDEALRQRIAEGLGDVLMLQGRYEEARAQAEGARRRGRRRGTGWCGRGWRASWGSWRSSAGTRSRRSARWSGGCGCWGSGCRAGG